MSTPASTPDPALTSDPTLQQQGRPLDAQHVPEPPSGVRGADQVDDFDNEKGQGTTRGADGDTAAREALRKDLGERSPEMGEESDSELEQAEALGSTDTQADASLQAGDGVDVQQRPLDEEQELPGPDAGVDGPGSGAR